MTMDFPELEDDTDPEELLKAAYKLWGAAKGKEDRRKAMLYWLQAAIVELDYQERSSPVVEENDTVGTLGDVLQATLQALDMGTTLPLLLPTDPGDEDRRRLGELAMAKARAVLVVDILCNHPKMTVKRAIEFVCNANGMSPKALESLRSHVHTGKKYREVQAHLQPIRDEWTEQAAFSARIGDPWTAKRFYVLLNKDKLLLSST